MIYGFLGKTNTTIAAATTIAYHRQNHYHTAYGIRVRITSAVLATKHGL
jgi:hypothetical protein